MFKSKTAARNDIPCTLKSIEEPDIINKNIYLQVQYKMFELKQNITNQWQ